MHTMKTKIETITPEYAIEVLETKNPRNRTVSEGIVQAYATDIKNKKWLTTHQGIAFDEKGNLIDGQHRLWAVVFANQEVEMNVTRDIPMKTVRNGIEVYTMDTIDRNRPRTMGQQMSLCHGIANPNNMAAACRAICNAVTPSFRTARLSTSNGLLIYNMYEQDLIETFRVLGKNRQTGAIHGMIAMYHKANPERAISFCHQITTLENLENGSRLLVRHLEQAGKGYCIDFHVRVVSNSLLIFENKDTGAKRLSDGSQGREWILSLSPSLVKEIRNSLRSCDVTPTSHGRLRINKTSIATAKKEISKRRMVV
jgi:hypothetical protein